MREYLTTEHIAIYGAIVGTLAIILNFLRYKHSKNHDKVNLKVSYQKSKEFNTEIENLGKLYNPSIGEGGSADAKIYEVTVHNIGNVDAYIKDIYLESIESERYKAKTTVKISSQNESLTIKDIKDINLDSISPKASKTFNIYLSNNQRLYEIKEAIVIDQTNKTWKRKKD